MKIKIIIVHANDETNQNLNVNPTLKKEKDAVQITKRASIGFVNNFNYLLQ